MCDLQVVEQLRIFKLQYIFEESDQIFFFFLNPGGSAEYSLYC